ncbi:MAG TPA: hypothetical protein VHN73_00165 [Phenylobacterium sp.]|nr:hypothetical protein [Phenylobacterium sp.]
MAAWHRIALVAGVTVAAGAAFAQQQVVQKVTGPVAVYWMSAQTQSGFGMPGMGSGGGGRPSMGQIMGMLGGGGGPQHSLTLQLGSSRTAQGSPAADHLPPNGLGAGPDLPLVTPVVEHQAPPKEEEEPPPVPREYQKPKGRMLIFWGCGEHAKPGQPLVIDFAQMSAGKIPPGMEMLGRGLGVARQRPPSQARNATYGEWPNAKTRTQVPSQASLVGDHTVQGNYSPTIKFALNPDQDFLGPLTLTTNAKTPAGSAQLGWAPVSGARAYLASAVGGGQDQTVVLWTSSEVEAAAFVLPDYLTPGDINRLVASKALMGPQTTACTVPKEVVDAAPQAMLQMVAYGEEANFVYPPRPKDPKVAWNQEWSVKVRYRSSVGGMLGMTMPGAGGGRGASSSGAGSRSNGAATPSGGPPRLRAHGQDAPPAQAAQAPEVQEQQPPPQTPEDAKAARRKAILKGVGGAFGLPF